MTLHDIFSSLGLSDRETSVFLKMLDTGPQTVGALSKSMDMPRSTGQFVMDKLVEMSLVQEFEGSGVKMYRCVTPRDILRVFNAKKKKIAQALVEYGEEIPSLEKSQFKSGPVPNVQWAQGKEAITQRVLYMYSWHAENKLQYFMYNPDILYRTASHLLNKEDYKNSTVVYEEMITDSACAREHKETFKDVPGVNITILPIEFSFTSDVSVVGDEVVMCVLDDAESDFLNIRAKNAQLARQIESMFAYVKKAVKESK